MASRPQSAVRPANQPRQRAVAGLGGEERRGEQQQDVARLAEQRCRCDVTGAGGGQQQRHRQRRQRAGGQHQPQRQAVVAAGEIGERDRRQPGRHQADQQHARRPGREQHPAHCPGDQRQREQLEPDQQRVAPAGGRHRLRRPCQQPQLQPGEEQDAAQRPRDGGRHCAPIAGDEEAECERSVRGQPEMPAQRRQARHGAAGTVTVSVIVAACTG